MDDQTKRENFSRLFPPQVEQLVKRLEVLGKKSNKHGYMWDQNLVHDAWVQIAIIFARTAESFGVKFEVLVDGTEVDYAKPKSTTKRSSK